MRIGDTVVLVNPDAWTREEDKLHRNMRGTVVQLGDRIVQVHFPNVGYYNLYYFELVVLENPLPYRRIK